MNVLLSKNLPDRLYSPRSLVFSENRDYLPVVRRPVLEADLSLSCNA